MTTIEVNDAIIWFILALVVTGVFLSYQLVCIAIALRDIARAIRERGGK